MIEHDLHNNGLINVFMVNKWYSFLHQDTWSQLYKVFCFISCWWQKLVHKLSEGTSAADRIFLLSISQNQLPAASFAVRQNVCDVPSTC